MPRRRRLPSRLVAEDISLVATISYPEKEPIINCILFHRIQASKKQIRMIPISGDILTGGSLWYLSTLHSTTEDEIIPKRTRIKDTPGNAYTQIKVSTVLRITTEITRMCGQRGHIPKILTATTFFLTRLVARNSAPFELMPARPMVRPTR